MDFNKKEMTVQITLTEDNLFNMNEAMLRQVRVLGENIFLEDLDEIKALLSYVRLDKDDTSIFRLKEAEARITKRLRLFNEFYSTFFAGLYKILDETKEGTENVYNSLQEQE